MHELAESVIRLLAAATAGALLGLEREIHEKPAGLRTNILIGVGACLFAMVSIRIAGDEFDPARVAAQVVTGVGFIGAGVILRRRGSVTGLTTAAVIWAVASVGLAFGCGYYAYGAQATFVVLLVLIVLGRLEAQIRKSHAEGRLRVVIEPGRENIEEVQRLAAQHGIPEDERMLGKRGGQTLFTARLSGPRKRLESLMQAFVDSDAVRDCRWG
jgi:putative Mg2+ transporter-C (MgtC) family protein